jgi:methyl-accepting chemotaxis protein
VNTFALLHFLKNINIIIKKAEIMNSDKLSNKTNSLQTKMIFFFAVLLLILSITIAILSAGRNLIEHIILGILLTLVGTGVMVFFVRLIFTRISRISEILDVIAHGEGNLSARIKVKKNDEIDVMSGLFNKCLERICELVSLIKDQTINLSNVGHELSENMNQTAGSVTEITNNIQDIKGHVINQSASVTETTATMEQVV